MNWNTLKTFGLGVVMMGSIVGCTFQQPRLTESDGHNSVTDINPPSLASSTPAPSLYQPAPVSAPQPTVTAQPSMSDTAFTSTPMTTSTPGSGSSHVVKKGETLYGIARKSYGDGKQWTKIAAANPGVSPQSLKVGQTIVIP